MTRVSSGVPAFEEGGDALGESADKLGHRAPALDAVEPHSGARLVARAKGVLLVGGDAVGGEVGGEDDSDHVVALLGGEGLHRVGDEGRGVLGADLHRGVDAAPRESLVDQLGLLLGDAGEGGRAADGFVAPDEIGEGLVGGGASAPDVGVVGQHVVDRLGRAVMHDEKSLFHKASAVLRAASLPCSRASGMPTPR